MTRWIALSLVVVGLLSAGIAVVPSGLERAFMALHDQEFTQAQISFEERWKKGDHSREVANALSELYLRLGQADRASDILVTLVNEHPGDRAALSRLAEIFRDAQQRDRHISTLERLWKQKKSPRLLRTLEKLYDLAGRENDRITALNELVRSPEAIFSDHAELAELLAPTNPVAALESLYNAWKRWPAEFAPDNAQTFIALAADNSRDDLLRTVILPWVHKRSDHAAIDAAVVTLTSRHKDALALEAALTSGALAKAVPLSIVLAARLEARAKRPQEAFARLEALRNAGRLPNKGDDVYVETALLTKNRDAGLAHVLKRGPENLPFWLQSWIVSKAVESGDTDFLSSMKAEFSRGDLKPRSFILARIELAQGNKARAGELAQQAASLAVDTSAGIAVAGLFAELGDRAQARVVLERAAPDPAHVPVDDLAAAITVAVMIADAPPALAMAEVLRETRPGETSDILYARALSVSGRSSEALQILDDLPDWSEAKEVAVFEALNASGQVAELQHRLYERIDADDATTAQRTNYVFMLNDFKTLSAKGGSAIVPRLADDLDDDGLTGAPRLSRIELLGRIDPAAAKPYAREAAEADPDHSSYIYLAVLKSLHANQEAVDYISGAIDDAELPATRDGFLYQWLELGVTKPALPWLRDRAQGSDRAWFFAYDEALKKLGENEIRVSFLSGYAKRPDIDVAFRGQLAHEILEAGAKDEAVALFRDEAASAPAASPQVEQLLFLWGPRPPAAAIEWISARARTATPAERPLWLGHLLASGATEEASLIAADFYVRGERTLAPLYAETLAQLKMDTQLRQLIATELRLGKLDVSARISLAQAAEERSLSHEASILYESASASDRKYLAMAGKQAWYSGEKSRAMSLLRQAAQLDQPDADTLFLYAEGLREVQSSAAQELYLRCAELTGKKSGRDDQRVHLLSLVRLGRFADAEVLIAGNTDTSLRADYAAALLDAGRTERAAQILRASATR